MILLALLATSVSLTAALHHSVAQKAATGQPAVPRMRAVRGAMDVLYFKPGDVNFAYGATSISQGAATANIVVTYDANFAANPAAQAAFEAAVAIWEHVIVSSVPIRVRAAFTPLAANVLGSGGPTAMCAIFEGIAFPAALTDARVGVQACASEVGETHEIVTAFNSAFAGWEFGTTGVGLAGKVNFMTVALHELAHGLAFAGTMTSDGTLGRYGTAPSWYDHWAQPGTGSFNPLVSFASPSAALHAQLTSDNTYFNGVRATASNSGLLPKMETHNFSTAYGVAGTLDGWLEGSSYVHLDDVLYTGTPLGLMTWALGSNEVYSDPGPVLRAIFEDAAWTTIKPRTTVSGCTFSLSASSLSVPPTDTVGSVQVITQNGCGSAAVNDSPQWLQVFSAAGTGSRVIDFSVRPNTTIAQRNATLTIEGHSFTVTQAAGDACPVYNEDWSDPIVSTTSAAATGWPITLLIRPDCAWTVTNDSPQMLTIASASSGTGPAGVDILIAANPSPNDRIGTLTFRGPSSSRTLQVTQKGIATIVPGDLDGDGRADLVVWTPSTGTWSWLTSSSGYTASASRQWGNQSLDDVPLLGDVDGDGMSDLVVWRASTGTWYWLTSSSGYAYAAAGLRQWGNTSLGDRPMLADMDGDHRADLVVWRASTGMWYWLTSSSGYDYAAAGGRQWGNTSYGDQVMLGEIDGDGIADLVVWRAQTGTWFWLTSSTGYDYAAGGAKAWGSGGGHFTNGDIPLVGDLDGDGKVELVVWRSFLGYYWLSSASGYDYAGGRFQAPFPSFNGDQPFLADFDADGRSDLTLWRADSGAGIGIWNATTGLSRAWGSAGDIK